MTTQMHKICKERGWHKAKEEGTQTYKGADTLKGKQKGEIREETREQR